MLLGETAHLTLPRDDYLISALVLDPPAELGGKPVLHWVASSGTDRLTIATGTPTESLLRKLGLQAPDGTGPFELPPPATAAPRPLPATGTVALIAARNAANANRFTPLEALSDQRKCRAARSEFGRRCAFSVGVFGENGLCQKHSHAVTRGEAEYDWSTRRLIT